MFACVDTRRESDLGARTTVAQGRGAEPS